MRSCSAPSGATPFEKFRTSDLGLAAWLTMHGHEPVRIVPPDITSPLCVVEFSRDDDIQKLIGVYSSNDGEHIRRFATEHNRVHRLVRDVRKDGTR